MPVDLTRSVLVILLPGAVAVAPWLAWLLVRTEGGLKEEYQPIAQAFAFGCAVIAGLICETLGTWLEAAWDEKRETRLNVSANWYDYLSRHIDPEPVAYRYLSRRATTLYFELSMMIAVLPFALGSWLFLPLIFPENTEAVRWLIAIATVLLELFFWVNALSTHELLCKTRAQVNNRLDKLPQGPPKP
jgi:cytochrome bd-type quinol oxidase subunit 2